MKFNLVSRNLFKRYSFKNWTYTLRTGRCIGTGIQKSNIVKSRAPSLDIPKGNLTKAVFRNVDKWWMKTALECSVTGKKVSYSELVEQSARWSGFLKQIGISRNEVVAIIAPNSIQFPPIFYGTAAIWSTLSPINWNYTHDEIKRMLDINKAKAIIYSPDVEANVAKALGARKKEFTLLCLGKSSELEATNVDDILYGDQKFQSVAPEELSGEDIVYMPFSSGTTGVPKAVALSHNAFIANLYQFMNPYHNIKREATDSFQNVTMGMLPFFHIYSLHVILSIGLLTGDKIVVVPQFEKDSFLRNIIQYKINCIHTVPTLLNLLNNLSECNPENMKHVDTLFCGAAPVHQSLVTRFKNKINRDFDFFEGFGMTEVLITNLHPKSHQKLGTSGQLLSNVEAKVIDSDTGVSLGPFEQGEICFKTPSVMKEYVNNPEGTKDILKGEWAHTGDIGYYDDEGFFSIVDRTKDLIKVQGMQVSPSEIEKQLETHPAVIECSVIGIPDDRRGEVPLAFVVPKKEVSEEELQKFLEDKLAKHKQLRGGIKFVDNIPKSETGKMLKKILRTMV